MGKSRALVAWSASTRHGARDPGLDAGKHRREERPLAFGRRPVRRREQCHVVLERPHAPLQHTDDRVARAVDRDRSSYGRRVLSESARPIRVCQHRLGLPARIVGRVEQSPKVRPLREKRKIGTGDSLRRDAFGDARVADRHAGGLIRRDAAEGRMILLEGAVVHDREAEAKWRSVGVDPDQRARIGVRQRVDQNGPDDANHRGGRAERDANREHDRDRHGRRAGEAADAVADVAPEMIHCRDPVVDRRTQRLEQQVQRIQDALPTQPATCGAFASLPAAELEQLGEIAVNRPAIGVADQQPQEPAHVRPCPGRAASTGHATDARVPCGPPSPRPCRAS